MLNPYRPPEETGDKLPLGRSAPELPGKPDPLKDLGFAVLLAGGTLVVMLVSCLVVAMVLSILFA